MPDDWFKQNAPPAVSASSDWFQQNSPSQQSGNSSKSESDSWEEPQGFLSRFGSMINPLPAILHPIDTAKAILSPNIGKFKEAADAFDAGQYGRSALSNLEGWPVVGGFASQVEQDLLKDHNYRGFAGTVAGMMAPEVLMAAKGKIPIRSSLNPVEQSAVSYGENHSIPVDLATASGNQFIRTAQEAVKKQPFLAGKANKLQTAQEQGIQNAGSNLAALSGPAFPKTSGPTQLGERIVNISQGRIESLDQQADQSYGTLRQSAANHVQRVQTGTRPAIGANGQPMVGPNGQPFEVPVFEDIAMPVSTKALKSTIKPVVDQLEKTIPEAQKQASPGLTALRNIMQLPDQVDINTAIRNLSSVQNLSRLGRDEIDAVRGVSKGLAATAVPVFRNAIDKAASVDPQALAALNKGRALTKAKYDAWDTVRPMLKMEPAAIVNRLTAPGDTGLTNLRSVQRLAPGEMSGVARNFLEGLMDDMFYQGDVRRAQSAVKKWHDLGDETKDILFPNPTIRQNATDFFNLVKMTQEKANASGSATSWAGLVASLHPKVLAAELIGGKPLVNALLSGSGPATVRNGIPISAARLAKPARAVTRINLLAAPPPPPPSQ